MVLLEEHLFADLAYKSGGAWSAQQNREFSVYSGGASTDWYTLAYTKGELIQKFQQALMGSMDSKGREYPGPPFSLEVKGGE